MNFEQGDIVTLKLPFSDLKGSKLRPVLVISNNQFNGVSNDLIVAKITGSFFHSNWEIKLTNRNLETGKLKKTSYIDVGFIFTIEKSIVRDKIAHIKKPILDLILEKLNEIIS